MQMTDQELALLIRAVQSERDNVLFGAATMAECANAQPLSELLERLENEQSARRNSV
jgi:hypothetical protein